MKVYGSLEIFTYFVLSLFFYKQFDCLKNSWKLVVQTNFKIRCQIQWTQFINYFLNFRYLVLPRCSEAENEPLGVAELPVTANKIRGGQPQPQAGQPRPFPVPAGQFRPIPAKERPFLWRPLLCPDLTKGIALIMLKIIQGIPLKILLMKHRYTMTKNYN